MEKYNLCENFIVISIFAHILCELCIMRCDSWHRYVWECVCARALQLSWFFKRLDKRANNSLSHTWSLNYFIGILCILILFVILAYYEFQLQNTKLAEPKQLPRIQFCHFIALKWHNIPLQSLLEYNCTGLDFKQEKRNDMKTKVGSWSKQI